MTRQPHTDAPRSARRSPPRDRSSSLISVVVVGALLLVVVHPVLSVVQLGFGAEGREAMGALWSSPARRQVVVNTIQLGVAAGVLGTLMGFCLAYVQVFAPIPGRRLVHVIALTPLISPPFALATATVSLFGRSGVFTNLTGIDVGIYGFKGLVFVLAISFCPIAYMNLRGLMQSLDPSLVEAATNLGAGRTRILLKVTLPLLVPGILSSFLLLFVESIADLANPLVLGGDYQVLATQIYGAVVGSYSLPTAAGYAVTLLVPAFLVFFLQRYWVSKKNVVTVTGKASTASHGKETLAVRITITAVALLTLAAVVAVYGLIVVGAFTRLMGIDNSLTLDNFRSIHATGASSAFLLTMAMSAAAAPVAALIGLAIAWIVVRRWKSRTATAVLDFTGMLGSAVPGTVLGIGAAIAFSAPIYFLGREVAPQLAGIAAPLGGILAIVFVYVARAIPAGQQAGIASLRQISPAVEEASTALGANGLTTFRLISLPLIRPAIVTALTYAVTRSMTVMTAIIFIVTPDTQVVTARTLDEVQAGRYGNAFAYCFILILVVLLMMGAIQLVVRLLFGRSPVTHPRQPRRPRRVQVPADLAEQGALP